MVVVLLLLGVKWQIYMAVRVDATVQIFVLVGLVGVVAEVSLLIGLVGLVCMILLFSKLLRYIHLGCFRVLVILIWDITFDPLID